jgi:hypothetical protein
MKRKTLIAAGVMAAMLASVGVAAAATFVPSTPPPVTAKACVTAGGVLKLATNTGACATGQKAVTVLAKGGPGTAQGYAHILPGGAFDASRSYNVKAANVVSNRAGFTCFRGLAFTPHNAAITLDYNGLFNGQLPQATLMFPTQPKLCGLTSAQAEVFTGLVSPGTLTPGARLGFYIVFY